MKVRWTSNSLRLRITPAELEQLLGGQDLRASLTLTGGWEVVVQTGIVPNITISGPSVRVEIPSEEITHLSLPDSEGVYFATSDDPPLHYFIEKDFPCVHPRPPQLLEPITETFQAPADFNIRHRS